MRIEKLKNIFLEKIVEHKKEYGVDPKVFHIGGGVFHELNTNDCDFHTPVRVFKGDSFVMGIKIEVIEPFDRRDFSVSTTHP